MEKILLFRKADRARQLKKILKAFQPEIEPRARILVKPSVTCLEDYPATTHPETLDTVLDFLVKLGKEVLVGDGPALSNLRPQRVIDKHPLRGVCRKHGLDLLNLNRRPRRHFSFLEKKRTGFSLSAVPFSCDYVISLAVLRVHKAADVGFAGALFSQLAYVSRAGRLAARFSREIRDRTIALANVAAKPDLTILDAGEVLLGAHTFRAGGRKAKLGVLLAGRDPVACDCCALELLKGLREPKLENKRPKDIGYLRAALELEVGTKDYTIEEEAKAPRKARKSAPKEP
ncbi:MAG: DUF362 domain-containing protein [Candidatus Aminicenantes bacterium]|nr:DUF362 domain-containing protein [Candidatus Aminicenantes bacterium]